jgi:glycosyltransferase involved in cell wall biosynthesis/SAM-dependent methyltransferase
MKIKVLYFNHPQQNCGVHQYGRLLADKLTQVNGFHFNYREVLSQREFVGIFEERSNADGVDVIFINYHPLTMPWLDRNAIISVNKPVIGILHEFDYVTAFSEGSDIFDFRALIDPSIPSRVPNVTSHPRALISYKPKVEVRPAFTVGSFGFATPSKCFDHVVALVKREYTEAVIRFNIPASYFCDPVGVQARKIADNCRTMLEGTKISLEVTHDFLSPQQLVDFLAENTINLFAYTDDLGRGISSVIDFAVAAGRPFGVSDSRMFRHLQHVCPEVFISKYGIEGVMENSDLPLKRLKQLWSDENLLSSYEKAAKNAIAAFDAFRIRNRLFNIVLDDVERKRYEQDVIELKEKCPQMMGRKIMEANVQQAFVKAAVEHFSKGKANPNILCVGSFEDTAYETLKAKGYNIIGIDPTSNVDLEKFYNERSTVKSSFDIIFSTSVIEHVRDDEQFISQIRDLLAVEGVAILTMDFNDAYREGVAKPSVDYRLYTCRDILMRLVARMHCCELVDCCFWQKSMPDFTHDGALYSFASLVFRRKRPDDVDSNYSFSLEKELLAKRERETVQLLAGQEELKRELNAQLESGRQETQRLKEVLSEREQEINSARIKIDEIKGHAHHWQTVADNLNKELQAVYASRSWRTTAPLRFTIRSARWFVNGAWAWLTLKPGSRPRRIAKIIIRRGIAAIEARPGLKQRIVSGAHRLGLYPALRRRYYRVAGQRVAAVSIANLADITVAQGPTTSQIALPLPPGSRTIFVFVDHTVRCSTNTGVQRVTRGIARSLTEAGERVRFVKWNADTQQCLLINATEREYLSKWNGPVITEEECGVYPREDEPQIPVAPCPAGENNWLVVPEVTHITFHARPVTLDLLMWSRHAGLKSGFVFYDVIPMRRPEFIEMAGNHAEYMQHLLLADVIWPISDWSGTDLKAYWTVDQFATGKTMPRVETQHLAGASYLRTRTIQTSVSEPLILCVGTVEPRKNQVQLIRAFQKLRQQHIGQDWRLLLVGNLHTTVAKEVRQASHLGSAILYLEHVSDQELDELYRSCAFTVFPSVEEGFGLPILESLWYGKPCLCANFGSMEEVARDGGCLMVDTTVQTELEAGLSRLITDTGYRECLARQALARPIRTWNDYAAALRANFDAAGNPAKSIGLVYYWVDATLQFPKNTGIQRVVRQLARALIENGLRMIPVKLDAARGELAPLNVQELDFLSRWNGPQVNGWHDWVDPKSAGCKAWFFMPELPLNRSAPERERILTSVRALGMRTSAVFHDAIPWKWRHIYPEPFSTAHRKYMLELSGYDLVLPNSEHTREDLVDFLGAELPRPQSLDDKVITVLLPGEFPESARVTSPKPRSNGAVRILSVGTVEPRKNHETLLRSFEHARQESGLDLHLTIVGGSHSIEPKLADRVREFIATHTNITWEENADDERLYELYQQADFTVYPSVEEGFGLPILESLWNGIPCICAGFGAMVEVARGGGCLMVDVRDTSLLSEAIRRMAVDVELRDRLVDEATRRPFKSWHDYGLEVALRMSQLIADHTPIVTTVPQACHAERTCNMRLLPRPKLSVCISTYNRAGWLSVSLSNWAQQFPDPLSNVELFVCDNASTDSTPQVVEPYLNRHDFRYKRNPKNVGMLGNLRETAHHANGEYVWIIGDDDLLLPGAVQRVLDGIHKNPSIALIYLNYAYTREEDPTKVVNFKSFFAQAIPIAPVDEDREGPIYSICSRNENFFTAIYALVLRRDHALRAYSQNTSGRPFSTMVTCMPTAAYVLNNLMKEPGLWIGAPQLVVNLNVSWMQYAPLWILERIPELYELAERQGVPPSEIDRWRRHTLPGIVHYFQMIFDNDPVGNSQYFSVARLVRRFKHLPEFIQVLSVLQERYSRAHAEGHPAAAKSISRVFPQLSAENEVM